MKLFSLNNSQVPELPMGAYRGTPILPWTPLPGSKRFLACYKATHFQKQVLRRLWDPSILEGDFPWLANQLNAGVESAFSFCGKREIISSQTCVSISFVNGLASVFGFTKRFNYVSTNTPIDSSAIRNCWFDLTKAFQKSSQRWSAIVLRIQVLPKVLTQISPIYAYF